MTVIETPAPATPVSHAPAVIDPAVAAREDGVTEPNPAE